MASNLILLSSLKKIKQQLAKMINITISNDLNYYL
ncbi:hypothetical protein SAMN05421594_3117 [Chryseobacterium oleae]|uniref:Uncharacterized protein n=1 Tax=Chryseobacterium oleae TaxID=491207 RepID=A0A1I4ZNB3_CHROL|nr:hypothetical protein SAMN05421594_3117 [Chryseobacterium oleae]